MKIDRYLYSRKYFVLAREWHDDIDAPTYEIVGEFTDYWLAVLFKNAYNEHHEKHAEIFDNYWEVD